MVSCHYLDAHMASYTYILVATDQKVAYVGVSHPK